MEKFPYNLLHYTLVCLLMNEIDNNEIKSILFDLSKKIILPKYNNLSKEDYMKETDALRKKVMDYQTERRVSVEKVAKLRAEARKMLLDGITPILETYTKENGISIVFDKKNLVMGDSDLDITKLVIEKLNIALPSIKLN